MPQKTRSSRQGSPCRPATRSGWTSSTRTARRRSTVTSCLPRPCRTTCYRAWRCLRAADSATADRGQHLGAGVNATRYVGGGAGSWQATAASLRRRPSAADAVPSGLQVPGVAPRPGCVAADRDGHVVPPGCGLDRVGGVDSEASGRYAESRLTAVGVIARGDGERHFLRVAVGQGKQQPWTRAPAVVVIGGGNLRCRAGSIDVAGESPQEAVGADDREVVHAVAVP